MTLILSETEKKVIRKALRRLAQCSQLAKDLHDTLSENEDCTEWLIMTKEERENLGK